MKTLNEYIGENYEILDDLCKRLQDDYDDLYRWIDDNYEVKKMTFLDNLIHFVEYI